MTITKTTPFTKEEIEKLKEQFDVYIKTVIDIDQKICIAGMAIHADGEKMLIEEGSVQKNIWGGGVDIETKIVDFNSFINIRPNDNNISNEILISDIREKYKTLSEYFFSNL